MEKIIYEIRTVTTAFYYNDYDFVNKETTVHHQKLMVDDLEETAEFYILEEDIEKAKVIYSALCNANTADKTTVFFKKVLLYRNQFIDEHILAEFDMFDEPEEQSKISEHLASIDWNYLDLKLEPEMKKRIDEER